MFASTNVKICEVAKKKHKMKSLEKDLKKHTHILASFQPGCAGSTLITWAVPWLSFRTSSGPISAPWSNWALQLGARWARWIWWFPLGPWATLRRHSWPKRHLVWKWWRWWELPLLLKRKFNYAKKLEMMRSSELLIRFQEDRYDIFCHILQLYQWLGMKTWRCWSPRSKIRIHQDPQCDLLGSETRGFLSAGLGDAFSVDFFDWKVAPGGQVSLVCLGDVRSDFRVWK